MKRFVTMDEQSTRALIGELRYHGETDPWCKAAADEIERLSNCHRIVAKQVGFYKPELPDFHKVAIHLGVLRAAERCAGKAPWEPDDADGQSAE